MCGGNLGNGEEVSGAFEGMGRTNTNADKKDKNETLVFRKPIALVPMSYYIIFQCMLANPTVQANTSGTSAFSTATAVTMPTPSGKVTGLGSAVTANSSTTSGRAD